MSGFKHKIAVISDKGHWAEEIPATRELNLYGLQIYMIHNRKLIEEDVSEKDIVICGHSHKYLQSEKDGVCFFNPGSCGPRRFHQEITMAILTVDERVGKVMRRVVHFVINTPQ